MSEYQANETYLGLYGSIPLLISQPLPGDGPKGNVGIYWINAAETWAEIYTANYTKDDEENLKRGAFWSSETNILEFVLMMAKTPKDILGKW